MKSLLQNRSHHVITIPNERWLSRGLSWGIWFFFIFLKHFFPTDLRLWDRGRRVERAMRKENVEKISPECPHHPPTPIHSTFLRKQYLKRFQQNITHSLMQNLMAARRQYYNFFDGSLNTQVRNSNFFPGHWVPVFRGGEEQEPSEQEIFWRWRTWNIVATIKIPTT